MSKRKDELINALVRLVAEGGVGAATIRAIARQVGVTEAAVYRHFRSKEELCYRANARIVDDMIHEKAHLVESKAPLRERLHEWIRLSFAFYDRQPDAFTYVLLTQLVVAKSEGAHSRQRGLLIQMLRRAREVGEIRAMAPEVAVCHFTGLMLNVPRLINEGTLDGPASKYVDEIAEAAWRVLGPDAQAHA